MKKLSGFSPVFSYTLKTHLKSKKFLVSTIIVGLLFFLGVGIAFYFLAAPEDKDKSDELSFKKVYVDIGDQGEIDLNAYVKALEYEKLKGCKFENVKDIKYLAEQNEKDKEFLGLTLQKADEKNTYNIIIIKGDDNNFESSDIDLLGEFAQAAISQYMLEKTGISPVEMMQASLMVNYEVIGAEKADENHMIAMIIVCMVVLMAVYFMALIYGAQISAEVSIEKTSKLVEQLLISVTPYGLVTGKIVALILVSIIQFFSWVACLVGGLFAGDALLKVMYSGYSSKLGMIADALAEFLGKAAVSPLAWCLAIISFILSIAIYLVFAGVAGAMVTRPEETSAMQGIFILPMIVAFYIALMFVIIPATSPDASGHIDVIYSMIPFVASFIAPGAILTGELSTAMSLVSIGINLAVIMLCFVLAAKVYKALLFFNGNKMNPIKAIKLVFKKSK